MGFSSQGGSVILRSQAVPGTIQTDFDTNGIGVLLRTGALQSNRDLLIPDPEIGGGRDVQNAYIGAASWSGSYEAYARMEMVKTLFKAAFGTAAAASTTTGVTTQSFTPSDAAQLPFLSIHEEIGAGLEVFEYTDAVVNGLHFTGDANAYLMVTADIIARIQTAGNATKVAATIDNTPMIVTTNIHVTYNSVTLPAKSFTFDFANNFDDSDFRLGSFFLGDLTPKRRDVTCNFNIRESSSALWRKATYGASGATEIGGITTPSALVISGQTYETIAGGTPLTSYGFTITIPNYILSPYSLAASGDDIIESGIDGRGVRPALATPLVTASVVSKTATIA